MSGGDALSLYVSRIISDAGLESEPRRLLIYSASASALVALASFAGAVYGGYSQHAAYAAIGAFAASMLSIYLLVLYIGYVRIRTIEELLPDFLSLMASNIRSGLTPDRAMLVSSRKEFGPLSKIIERAAKQALTGKPIDEAFLSMSVSVRSEIFSKSIRLIVEGIRSGGELHGLLESASLDMRRFAYLRKEVSSTVLVYELFLFSASALGAPLLYGVTNFLLGVVSSLRDKMSFDTSLLGQNTLMAGVGEAMLDPAAVFIFSIIAIFSTVLFGCLASGIITRGREIEGLKYFPPLLILAYLVFFGTISALQLIFSRFFMF